MSRPPLGTLAWALSTGGILSRSERGRLLGQAVMLQVRVLPAQIRQRLGMESGRAGRFDVHQLRLPDSEAARKAEALTARQPAFLANHCYRTYAFGTLLGAHDGIDHDAELLYVACLLHDVGLVDGYDSGRCFTLPGANAAVEVARDAGWEERRGELAAEAIALHMNLRVGLGDGPEAHLVAAGAQLDVIGARSWELSRTTVAAVGDRYPRDGFKRGFADLTERHAHATPGSRAHFYSRYMQLRRRMEKAPLPG